MPGRGRWLKTKARAFLGDGNLFTSLFCLHEFAWPFLAVRRLAASFVRVAGGIVNALLLDQDRIVLARAHAGLDEVITLSFAARAMRPESGNSE